VSTQEIRFVSQSVHSNTKLTITIICDARQSDDHPRDCHSDSCCDCGQTDDSDFMVGRVTAAAASCSTVRRTPRVRGRTASTRRVDVEVTGWCRAIRIWRRGAVVHNEIIRSGSRRNVVQHTCAHVIALVMIGVRYVLSRLIHVIRRMRESESPLEPCTD